MISPAFPILVDCDEVLSDFVGEILRLAALAGVHATRDDVTEWDIGKAIGWPDWTRVVTERLRSHDLCARMGEMPGAIAWLRRVEEEFGVDRVFVCTSPWDSVWAGQRAAWLEQRGVPIKRQIQMSPKHLVRSAHLIDDAVQHIERRPWHLGFLIDRPWNAAPACPDHARGGYDEALTWLRAVAT